MAVEHTLVVLYSEACLLQLLESRHHQDCVPCSCHYAVCVIVARQQLQLFLEEIMAACSFPDGVITSSAMQECSA